MSAHRLALSFEAQSDFSPIVEAITRFHDFGKRTACFQDGTIKYFVNEFWTARQRQSHSIHEVSYRACFKAELPRFFIERLSSPGQIVYDPFMGRGTTPIEAFLLGRRAAGSDINPLSALLARPRINPPSIAQIAQRLAEIQFGAAEISEEDELHTFYHPETLREIVSLRNWLFGRRQEGRFDDVDDWIRMVAINRLTGHSPGFFSVYTLPPNQAVSINAQKKINADRNQTPGRRSVPSLILKKSKSVLADRITSRGPAPILMTGPAWRTPELADRSVSLVVTSPPFLDVVDYAGDNWLRCWFAGIDPASIRIDRHKDILAWEGFVRKTFEELARVVRPNGHVCFEVGEVRGGRVLLERHVIEAVRDLPFALIGVMVNDQSFTKTSNCWGVTNNARGTNTNRIVMFRRA